MTDCPSGKSVRAPASPTDRRHSATSRSVLEMPYAMLARIKTWARKLKRDSHAIYLASRDPRVPWYAKALAIAVAAYALSPIDLIPDFIPVLGYVDDLVIVPLGVWLVVSLVPANVMMEYRSIASASEERPVSKVAAIF